MERELKQREPAQWTAAVFGAQGEALKQAEQVGHACSLAKARLQSSGPCISDLEQAAYIVGNSSTMNDSLQSKRP